MALTPSCEKGSGFPALPLSSLDNLTFCLCSRTTHEVNGDVGLPSKCYFIRYQVLISHESLVARGSFPDTDISNVPAMKAIPTQQANSSEFPETRLTHPHTVGKLRLDTRHSVCVLLGQSTPTLFVTDDGRG